MLLLRPCVAFLSTSLQLVRQLPAMNAPAVDAALACGRSMAGFGRIATTLVHTEASRIMATQAVANRSDDGMQVLADGFARETLDVASVVRVEDCGTAVENT